jgi:putative ABC transport system permease protein
MADIVTLKLRDLTMRATAFVDGCARDGLYAFNAFRRAPLAALTIVTTVGLGLGLVAVVFTLLNVVLFRVDEIPRPSEMFAVERPRTADGTRVLLTQPQYEALRRETAVFSDVAAMVPEIDTRIEGRKMSGTLVSGNFFQVVGVEAALGRTLTPADDDASATQPAVVLSHRGWSRLFQSDAGVMGRTAIIGGVPFTIVGVMPEGFRGLAVGAPDCWAPLATLGQLRPIPAGGDHQIGIDVVGRLRPGMSRATALAGLMVWDSARAEPAPVDRRSSNITLEPRQGTIPQPIEAVIVLTPIFFAFGLILLIGCANVANLLLARAVSRQREIGVRLSLGASRRRIVRQLLTESLLLALAAAALGFAISRQVLGITIYAVTSTMPPDIGDVRLDVPAADWRVAIFLIGGAVVSTLFFALAPALQATRLELVRTIRGEVTRDARPGRARNVLIGVQVTASALLLIGAAVFLRSALASTTVDPGIRTADTVLIEVANESRRVAMIRDVQAEPSVTAVSAAWPGPLGSRAAFAEHQGTRSHAAYKFVSPDYFDVLGIEIVRGRGFRPVERGADAGVLVVSESVARRLWPQGDILGETITLEPDANSETRRTDEPPLSARTFTVVGIARDVPGFRFADSEEADVYVPISASAAKTSLIVRVHGDPEQARQALLQRLTLIDPNMGEVVTMRTVARIETYFLQIAFWITLMLGGLALVLTLSGLFSVLSYLVEQRRKEIGVRMALGASARSIGALIVSQSARPVGVGVVIGAALAAALGIVLLTIPNAAPIAEIVHLLDPVAYVASLICILAACALAALIPAWRAARVDPVATLRAE